MKRLHYSVIVALFWVWALAGAKAGFVGSPFDIYGTTVNDYRQTSKATVWGNNQYLSAFTYDSPGVVRLLAGRFISSSGSPGTALDISGAQSTSCDEPAVAFRQFGSSDYFGIVYVQTGAIKFVVYTSSGTRYTGPYTVDAPSGGDSCWGPDICDGGSSGDQFLISWTRGNWASKRGDIYARHAAIGSSSLGTRYQITRDGATTPNMFPKLIHRPHSSGSLGARSVVVWQRASNTSASNPDDWSWDIRARVIAANGNTNLSGSQTWSLSAETQPETQPRLAYSSASDTLFFAWELADTSNDHDIWGRALTFTSDHNNLQYVSSAAALRGTGNTEVMPSVAWDATYNQFHVVWSEAYNGDTSDYDVQLLRIRADGVVVDTDPTSVVSTTGSQLYPSLANGNGTTLVTWQDGNYSKLKIRGQRYQSDSAVALLQDGWLTDAVDVDGDGYYRSVQLNLDPDVSPEAWGGLSVYEKVYAKLSGGSSWILQTTLSDHTITGGDSTDEITLDLSADARGFFAFRMEILRTGNSSVDAYRDDLNDDDLSNIPMEPAEEDIQAPGKASSPSPAHGASGVSISADLNWAGGSSATGYKVYFGTDSTPDGGEFKGASSATSYDPGTLQYSTTYYWTITSTNRGGETSGDVWSFTTAPAPPSPPSKAVSPSPANGASGQSIQVDLGWANGGGATGYDVYFGTDSSPDDSEWVSSQQGTTFDPGPLSYSTTYYWTIVANNSGGSTLGDVWSFTTASAPPSPPAKATNPSPSNGAGGQDINVDVAWANGGGATSYDVYFGTDSTPDSTELVGTQAGTGYDPGSLSYGTTYYWTITAKNSGGNTAGDVWSFTTGSAPPVPPTKAANPTPAHGATGQGNQADLGWINGGGATSFDVYFGTDSTPDSTEFKGNQAGTGYDPGALSYSTTYYWTIVARNSVGTTVGDIWMFTTGAAPPSPPAKAVQPNPAHGATGVPEQTTLTWQNGGGATSYDVYVNGSFVGNVGSAIYGPTTWSNATTYTWRVDARNANGVTGGDTWTFTTTQLSTYPVNDFDGDRKSDLAVFYKPPPSYGYTEDWSESMRVNGRQLYFRDTQFYVLSSRTGGRFISNFVSPGSGYYALPITGQGYDYNNGERYLDHGYFNFRDIFGIVLGWQDTQDGYWGCAPYYGYNGVWGWRDTIPVPSDYDGDGVSDQAVYHAAGGRWYIVYSSTQRSRTVNWGWSQAMPVPADYDGDGKADPAVYHPAQGNWYILYSRTGNVRVQNWGWSETIPVPGDYDGDRRDDPAVYHPASGNWYVLASRTGSAMVQNWGWKEAVPVPGDYDGDGKMDMSVYHRAAGKWYIRESSTSRMVTRSWGWSEATPLHLHYQIAQLWGLTPLTFNVMTGKIK